MLLATTAGCAVGPEYQRPGIEVGETYKQVDGWVSAAFFDELEAEIRNKDGTWTKVRARNETFDHLRMQRALLLRLGVFKVDDWSKVPPWLAPVKQNAMAITRQDRREVQANTTLQPTEQVRQAAPTLYPAPQRRKRRSSVAAL